MTHSRLTSGHVVRWAVSLLAGVGCASGEPKAGLGPNQLSPADVTVVATQAAITTGEVVMLRAQGTAATGQPVPVEVDWTASGGTIVPASDSEAYFSASNPGSYTVRAQEVSSPALHDSTTITVTSAVSPTVALTISPSSVTLLTGGVRAFSAIAARQDGSSYVPSVNWAATGGTVTSGGLYTAGSTAGSFRVIATQQGGTLADTAAVTLTLAPPPSTNPNEPAGMTVRTNTSWNLGFPPQLPAHNADGWAYEYAGSAINGSIYSDPTAPFSPSNVLRTTYPAGFVGGSAPVNLEISLPGNPRTVYVSMWLKRSAGWSDNGNAMTKHFFIWADQSGDHGFVAITNLQGHFFALETVGNGNQFDYYGPVEDAYGSWRRYEYVFTMNTPGNADGTFTAWRNGVQIMNRTGIRWVAAGVTPGFTRVQWSPTYGGGSNPVPATQYIDVDHFYISTK